MKPGCLDNELFGHLPVNSQDGVEDPRQDRMFDLGKDDFSGKVFHDFRILDTPELSDLAASFTDISPGAGLRKIRQKTPLGQGMSADTKIDGTENLRQY